MVALGMKGDKKQMVNQLSIEQLECVAKELRRLIVTTSQEAGGAHFGGSLSMVEILTVLYWKILKIDPERPNWEQRDYFILSKGHGNAGLAPTLAKRGFFAEELLEEFNSLGSSFGMHTSTKEKGVEHSTGSLGHGLSVGLGIALGLRIDNKGNRVFILQGDGEIQEGSVWEGAMAAGGWGMDNLITIIDRNGFSMDGLTEEIVPLEPLKEKWESFNWSVKVCDGHSIRDLSDRLSEIPFQRGKPSCLIAKTTKGKGISFMENKYQWHYGYMSAEEYETAKRELDG
jgi:transketolase